MLLNILILHGRRRVDNNNKIIRQNNPSQKPFQTAFHSTKIVRQDVRNDSNSNDAPLEVILMHMIYFFYSEIFQGFYCLDIQKGMKYEEQKKSFFSYKILISSHLCHACTCMYEYIRFNFHHNH